jgi:hypothetical protein
MECDYVSYDYVSLDKYNRIVKLLKLEYYEIDAEARYFIIKSETEFNYCKVFDTKKSIKYEDIIEKKPDVKINCKENERLDPESNICISKNAKECNETQIRNPKSKRCVSRESKIGKKIVDSKKDTRIHEYKIFDVEFPIKYNDCLVKNVISYYKKLYSTFILNSETQFEGSEFDDMSDMYTRKIKSIRCHTQKYPKCMEDSRSQLYNLAKNCKSKDKERKYIKPISSYNKKELCRFIRTHPNLRRVSEKFKNDIEKFKDLYKEKDIEDAFIQQIVNSDYKYDIKQHSGIVNLFYLLIRFYNDNKVFFIDIDKDSIENTKKMSHARWETYNEKFFMPKKFISFLNEGNSNIKILKLSLRNEADGHSNLLVFNTVKKEFHRYDSGGTKHNINYDIDVLENRLEELGKDLGYTYRYDFELCPDLNLANVNVLYKAKEKIEKERGFCAIHTNLLIELTILENSDDIFKTQSEFIDKIIKSKYTLIYFLRKYKAFMFGFVTEFIKSMGYEGDETESEAIEQFLDDNAPYIFEYLLTNQ